MRRPLGRASYGFVHGLSGGRQFVGQVWSGPICDIYKDMGRPGKEELEDDGCFFRHSSTPFECHRAATNHGDLARPIWEEEDGLT